MENYSYYLIVDLEATCCDQQTIPREQMETIEIGAVMVSAQNWEIVDQFSCFIQPVRNPILTHFCTELTSIRQADLESAPQFPEALELFKRWLYQYSHFLFCSWGDYDKRQLKLDCQFHRQAFPIGAPHVNIKARFSEVQNLKKKWGMAQALELCNLSLEGRHHRGIDDARNMAKILPFIWGGKRIRDLNSSQLKLFI